MNCFSAIMNALGCGPSHQNFDLNRTKFDHKRNDDARLARAEEALKEIQEICSYRSKIGKEQYPQLANSFVQLFQLHHPSVCQADKLIINAFGNNIAYREPFCKAVHARCKGLEDYEIRQIASHLITF